MQLPIILSTINITMSQPQNETVPIVKRLYSNVRINLKNDNMTFFVNVMHNGIFHGIENRDGLPTFLASEWYRRVIFHGGSLRFHGKSAIDGCSCVIGNFEFLNFRNVNYLFFLWWALQLELRISSCYRASAAASSMDGSPVACLFHFPSTIVNLAVNYLVVKQIWFYFVFAQAMGTPIALTAKNRISWEVLFFIIIGSPVFI